MMINQNRKMGSTGGCQELENGAGKCNRILEWKLSQEAIPAAGNGVSNLQDGTGRRMPGAGRWIGKLQQDCTMGAAMGAAIESCSAGILKWEAALGGYYCS